MTPTFNSILPFRSGGFESLREALDYAALGETGLNFFNSRGFLERAVSYRELRDRARMGANWLLNRGIRPGSRVALIGETGPDFLVFFYACQYGGFIPCPLPGRLPIGSPEAYICQLKRFLGQVRANLVLVPLRMLDTVREAVKSVDGLALMSYEEALDAQALESTEDASIDNEVAYIQFTSGSTSAPKGVVITQRALMENASAIAAHGLTMREADRAFSWLPFYHDMGLVGFSVVALCAQRSVDYIAPASFAARPALWLRLMSLQGSTITYAPAFCWHIAAQRAAVADDLNLTSLRVAGIGGDLVRVDLLEACAEILSAFEFDPNAFQPSYGMAEATLAISMSEVGQPLHIEEVIISASGSGDLIATPVASDNGGRKVVSSGRALPGVEIRVCTAEGIPLPDRHVGHLWVRGPSIMNHYVDALGLSDNVQDTDGFFRTGDVGYLNCGEVFVTGRAKDMLALNGRNIWYADVEHVAEAESPLGPGDTVAFAIERSGQELLVLLVQRRIAEGLARETFRSRLKEVVFNALGVIAEIHFVPARSIPVTTSGKLVRHLAREHFLSSSSTRGT